jgi:hypothetical protein
MICRDRVVPVIVRAMGVSISNIVSQGVGRGTFLQWRSGWLYLPIHEAAILGMATFPARRTGDPAPLALQLNSAAIVCSVCSQ